MGQIKKQMQIIILDNPLLAWYSAKIQILYSFIFLKIVLL